MRIRILSDLHREFGETEIPKINADLIVLAGDINTKQNALHWIEEFSAGTPCIYISGNHEFYGDKLPRVTERLKELTKGSNIQVLENDVFEIAGWHIFGCTLWTDLELLEDWQSASILAGSGMHDYKRIRNSSRGFKRLSPQDTRLLHHQSLLRMEEFLKSHNPERCIIVTHHAPSISSFQEADRAEPINCAYASNLNDFILRHQPAIWIHGHIHQSSDYRIAKTRIIANPQGYPHAPNPKFEKGLIVIIE